MSELTSGVLTGFLAAAVAWVVADWRCRQWRDVAGHLRETATELQATAALWREAAEGWKAAATEWRAIAKERKP